MMKNLDLYMQDVTNNFEYGKILAFVLEIESGFETIIQEMKKIEEKNILNYDLKQYIEVGYSNINDARKNIYSLLFEEIVSNTKTNNNEKNNETTNLSFTDDKLEK